MKWIVTQENKKEGSSQLVYQEKKLIDGAILKKLSTSHTGKQKKKEVLAKALLSAHFHRRKTKLCRDYVIAAGAAFSFGRGDITTRQCTTKSTPTKATTPPLTEAQFPPPDCPLPISQTCAQFGLALTQWSCKFATSDGAFPQSTP